MAKKTRNVTAEQTAEQTGEEVKRTRTEPTYELYLHVEGEKDELLATVVGTRAAKAWIDGFKRAAEAFEQAEPTIVARVYRQASL